MGGWKNGFISGHFTGSLWSQRSCGLTVWLLCWAVSRSGSSIHEQSEDRSGTRSYSSGIRVFLFRFWIIPEPPAPVPLDKGNRGSGNVNEMIVDANSSKIKFITTRHIPLARSRYSWCWPKESRPLGTTARGIEAKSQSLWTLEEFWWHQIVL